MTMTAQDAGGERSLMVGRKGAPWSQLRYLDSDGKPRKTPLPAAAGLGNARDILKRSNLLITGGTGSGKTHMAVYLAVTDDRDSIDCIIAQHKKGPQQENYRFISTLLPTPWREGYGAGSVRLHLQTRQAGSAAAFSYQDQQSQDL